MNLSINEKRLGNIQRTAPDEYQLLFEDDRVTCTAVQAGQILLAMEEDKGATSKEIERVIKITESDPCLNACRMELLHRREIDEHTARIMPMIKKRAGRGIYSTDFFINEISLMCALYLQLPENEADARDYLLDEIQVRAHYFPRSAHRAEIREAVQGTELSI